MDHTCHADVVNPNLGSQGNATHSYYRPEPLTPHIDPQNNTRGHQTVTENDLRSNGTAQLVSPHLLAQTPNSKKCKCQKTSSEMRDTGTQTTDISTPEKCNVSTQCSPVLDSMSEALRFNLYPPPVDMPVQDSATRRQTGCTDAAESDTHTSSSSKFKIGGNNTPRSNTKCKTGPLSGTWNKVTANNSEGRAILQRPTNPIVDILSMTDARGRI